MAHSVEVVGDGFDPPTQEVGCVAVVGVWWNAIDVPLVLSRLCCTIGMFVDFQWASGGRSKNGPPQGTRWVCSGLSVH